MYTHTSTHLYLNIYICTFAEILICSFSPVYKMKDLISSKFLLLFIPHVLQRKTFLIFQNKTFHFRILLEMK